MSYLILFLLITGGYILGAPLFQESLQFRIVECLEGENGTLSNHVLEVTNVYESCIRVNKSSATGNEVYLHVAPATDTGVQVHITTENCSTPLPDLHLSFCDNETDYNFTNAMATFKFQNLTNDLFDNDTSAEEPMPYTAATVYEIYHPTNGSDEEGNSITHAAFIHIDKITTKPNSTSSSSSSSSEEDQPED